MSLLLDAIRVAGLVQLGMAAANFALPRQLDYRTNLARLSPIVRQIFIVHSIYIVLVLAIFGGLSVLFPRSFLDGAVGAYLAGALALFWLLRLALQLVYYDREFQKRHLWTSLGMLLAVAFLSAVYLAALLVPRL